MSQLDPTNEPMHFLPMASSAQEEMLAAITAKVLPIAAAACTEVHSVHWATFGILKYDTF